MTQKNSYKFPLILAGSLHLLLFIALFLHFVPQLHLGPGPEVKIINAAIVDQRGAAKIPDRSAEIAKQQKILQQQLAAKQLQQQRDQEKQQQLQQAQQQVAQQKQQDQLAAQQALAKQEVQQQKLAAQVVQQQKIAAQQQAKQKAVKLKQQQQAALTAQRKVAQKQLAQKLQTEQQQILQQQITQEQQQLTAAAATSAHNQQIQNEVDKYKALILQTVGQNWLVPDGVDKSLSSVLLIQIGPGGVVLGVQVVTSSGNPALDNSATAAIYKSSPLPVPSDPELFDKFRQLRLTMKPENVLQN